jgi:hypothetical protein
MKGFVIGLKELTRVIALVLLVAVLVVQIPYFSWVRNETLLILVGGAAIFLLVLWDMATGFLLALALLVALYRTHVNHLNVFGWISSHQDNDYSLRTKSLYTTADHLERAQTNVVDKVAFEKEMVGIQGVYGEPVYSAQGLNTDRSAFQGWDTSKTTAALNYPLTGAA